MWTSSALRSSWRHRGAPLRHRLLLMRRASNALVIRNFVHHHEFQRLTSKAKIRRARARLQMSLAEAFCAGDEDLIRQHRAVFEAEVDKAEREELAAGLAWGEWMGVLDSLDKLERRIRWVRDRVEYSSAAGEDDGGSWWRDS